MPLILNGSTGISGTDGSAATPAVQGTDTNTGMFFPAADQIAFAEGGTEVMRIDASGNVGIGTSSPGERLQVSGGNIEVLGAAASSFTGIINQNNGASGSAYRGLFYDARNENGVAVANMLVDVNADGSSAWSWSTTPAGSRSSDRRVDRARITSDGNFQFNSGYGSVATAFGCRAWVNFNGTGTVAIRASGNVSSITDNNTGDYTVNFTTAMPDINYSAPISFSGENGARNGMTDIVCATGAASARTTSAIRIATSQAGVSTNDCSFVNVAVFR
jgi:hypothetical protein